MYIYNDLLLSNSVQIANNLHLLHSQVIVLIHINWWGSVSSEVNKKDDGDSRSAKSSDTDTDNAALGQSQDKKVPPGKHYIMFMVKTWKTDILFYSTHTVLVPTIVPQIFPVPF